MFHRNSLRCSYIRALLVSVFHGVPNLLGKRKCMISHESLDHVVLFLFLSRFVLFTCGNFTVLCFIFFNLLDLIFFL